MRRSGSPRSVGLISLAGLMACGSIGTGAPNGAAGGSIAGSGGAAGEWDSSSVGGSAASSLDRDAACISDSREGEQAPLDLYFMVDTTGSMNCRTGPDGPNPCPVNGQIPIMGTGPTRWVAEKTALESFVGNPGNSGIGVGIGFFPQLGSGVLNCAASAYVDPPGTVEVASLPGSAPALTAALNARPEPIGGTPTTASLDGALQHVKSWATQHPDRRAALVYVTDGEPDGCDATQNTIANAAALAASAFAGQPRVATFVLGVGFELDGLNRIAASGGTGLGYLVDTGQDVATALANALESIRRRAVSCDYIIPATSDSGKVDYGRVNVQITVGPNGVPTLVGQVPSGDACVSGGWYYDDPSLPTKITLCKSSCDPLLSTAGSRLEILVGCKTISIVS